jgi:hypothetical protein
MNLIQSEVRFLKRHNRPFQAFAKKEWGCLRMVLIDLSLVAYGDVRVLHFIKRKKGQWYRDRKRKYFRKVNKSSKGLWILFNKKRLYLKGV